MCAVQQMQPPYLNPAVEKVLVHESLAGEKLDTLLKALQGAGGRLCYMNLASEAYAEANMFAPSAWPAHPRGWP